MNNLPRFDRTKHKTHIEAENRTAWFIQQVWKKSSKRHHADPKFLKMLIQATWINNGGDEALRRWRNKKIVAWLQPGTQHVNVAKKLSEKLGVSPKKAQEFLDMRTGFTHYYPALRTNFLKQVDKHSKAISKNFTLLAASNRKPVKEAVYSNVASWISKLEFPIPKRGNGKIGHTLMMNGLTPALACMDVNRHFPVVNAQTSRLLSAIGRKPDIDGILSLIRYIGQNGIKDSFELDVYSMTQKNKFTPIRAMSNRLTKSREIERKSEEIGFADINRQKKRIRKEHNILINKFRQKLEWKYKLEEANYDVLIRNWQSQRSLLIEAKTATSGDTGRTQLRQAIGQLFDYRWEHFYKNTSKVDIALLTPKKPEVKILKLLRSLKIEALWFEDEKLDGTIDII